jgi:hypothetical protein
MALAPTTARVFSLVEFYQILPPGLVTLLRGLLTVDSDQHILARLVEITSVSSSAVRGLSDADRDNVPSLFQKLLMSTIDRNGYSAARIQGNYSHPSSYEVGAFRMAGQVEQESVHNMFERTMARGGSGPEAAAAAIRHLLQASDSLPDFGQVPRVSSRAFLEEYLVKRGPPEYYFFRQQCLHNIAKCDDLADALQRATLERTKEIRALSAFTRITEAYTALDLRTAPVRDDLEKVFISVLYDRFLKSKMKTRPSVESCAKNPNNLLRPFVELKGSLPEIGYVSPFTSDVVYGFLTEGFEFERFRRQRSDLAQFDRALGDRIGREVDQLIALAFGERSSPWLVERAGLLKGEVAVLGRLRVAFVESNPIRKLGEIDRAMAAVKGMFARDGREDGFGEDEMTPIRVAYTFVANPTCIVSNLVFMHDMCGAQCLKEIFESVLTRTQMTLIWIVTRVLNQDPTKWFRLRERLT